MAFLSLLLAVFALYARRRINKAFKKQDEISSEIVAVSSTLLGMEKNENVNFDDKVEQLIQDHHKQAITQATVQFWFSLAAAVIGFIFIVVIIMISDSVAWYEYVLKLVPGIIIETVSVLFFSQSKDTRERASDFLNRLREDRQYAKSINIVESITDEKLKAIVKAKIALSMSNVETENGFLEKYLSE